MGSHPINPTLTVKAHDRPMTNYRRIRFKGGSYFFTVALERRESSLLTDHIDDLRAAYAATWQSYPWRCDAFVVMPDHLHAVWTLPGGDVDYSMRWRLIKARFSRAVGLYGYRSKSKREKSERGIWQRRFWEHTIRDKEDYDAHIRYCWGNPVKHGLCDAPMDWPYSSIHRDIRLGKVDPEWTRRMGGSHPSQFLVGGAGKMGAEHPSYGEMRPIASIIEGARS